MHPLRIPNSGIRAKVPLRVMRLNHVELFYTLVAAIGSESRHSLRGRGGHMHAVYMQRWLAIARPPVGMAGHGLATCRGRPPAGTAECDQPARGCRQQGWRRRSQGWSPLGRATVPCARAVTTVA
ncbi:hypothetical protein BHE74_00039803 [Ensete ventricosum]|nr:hypothetical protein BHE74_00039803 [Ensete ventricosum]